MKSTAITLHTLILSFADLAIVNGLFALLLVIFPDIKTITPLREQWLTVNVAYIPVMLRLLLNHRQPMAMVMEKVAREAFIVVLIHCISYLSLTALLGIHALPVMAYLVYYALMAIALPSWWILSRYMLKLQKRRGKNISSVAVIGTGPLAMQLAEDLEQDTGHGYRIDGYFDLYPRKGFKYPGLYKGSISELMNFAAQNNIRKIYFAVEEREDKMFAEALDVAENLVLDLYFVPRMPYASSRNYDVETLGNTTLMSARVTPLSRPLNRMVKRMFDIAFSSVAMIFYPFVYLPVALLIKSGSPGPVYFRQKRTGYHGEEFECIKFRTMRVNDDADTRQATQDDPRKTKVGEFLRKTNLDELPQFINVLKGDMSIVGPRPHMLVHTEVYSKLVSKYMMRHAVKPGITGWAQVNGLRGATDRLWKMEKRVQCDLWYVENWSFLLDVKIIFRTVLNVIHGEKNAY